MNIRQYSYRFAESVLSDSAFQNAFDELIQVLRAAPPVLYPIANVKMRQRGKAPARAFPVDQKAMNRQIEGALPAGWDIRPLVVPHGVAVGPVTNIRSDFSKTRIQVEVQFGNMARWYTDVFKFQLAYSLDTIDVGILVVPMHRFANLIDENVASFERVLRELPWAKMSLTLPILVIGIEPDDYRPIRERYEEAGAIYLEKEKIAGKTRALRAFDEAIAADDEVEAD